MSERYTKLFSLEENLYAEGSPVIISAGMLSKDNQTGKVIAQIKLKSIVENKIKAATICLTPLDTVGEILGERITQQYLDLNISYGNSFGEKQPIIFTDKTTRGFIVEVIEIIFEDNSIWKSQNNKWEKLNEPIKIKKKFNDPEFIKQYILDFGISAKYTYSKEKDLWCCACGNLNKENTEKCNKCGIEKKEIENLNVEKIEEEIAKRLVQERLLAERQAIEDAKTKKVALITLSVLVVLFIIGIFTAKYLNLRNTYNYALALVDEQEYALAIETFESLGNYKDSKIMAEMAEMAETEVKYQQALYYLENQNFSDAKDIFANLKDYKDCKNYAEYEVDYQEAIYLIKKNEVNDAKIIFEELGDYKDSKTFTSNIILACTKRSYMYYYYSSYGYQYSQNVSQEFEYDSYGRIREEVIDGDENYTFEIYYDSNKLSADLKIKSTTTDIVKTNDMGLWEKLVMESSENTYKYKYNESGEVSSLIQKAYDSENKLISTVTVTYFNHDLLGKIVKSVDYNYTEETGTKKNQKIEYTYSLKNEKAPITVTVAKNEEESFELEYNWIYVPSAPEKNYSNLNFLTNEFFLLTYY